jgi:hypothetical protein
MARTIISLTVYGHLMSLSVVVLSADVLPCVIMLPTKEILYACTWLAVVMQQLLLHFLRHVLHQQSIWHHMMHLCVNHVSSPLLHITVLCMSVPAPLSFTSDACMAA